MLMLDGIKVRDFHVGRLTLRAKALSCRPTLALFQIGDNAESSVYIRQKKKFAELVGALVIHRHFPTDVSFDVVARAIRADNLDEGIHGIILQLPVPPHIDGGALIEVIDPRKDVDGLTMESQALLAEGKPRFVPATAKAVKFILDFYGISVAGKKAAVLGRSKLVGLPASRLIRSMGADVTVCHSQTPNTREVTLASDIVIVAIGKPGLIGREYFKKGAVIIDVGINSVMGEASAGRRLVGDVDHEAAAAVASAMTPVPGGVGPVTVLSLFDTLMESAEDICRINP
ncbi:MAG: bifunctional 5,10-methylenetetrahydrofolate dehydrogenase/5,10-methenyltetrahydrofolate cyclohydrolase [Candidatus Paceibacterota bacterium]|jgi:5,10-methylene-tetrahydrofolate dehydrogenase/methenyl tetrahydrofolate cyclohydrolase